MIGTIRQQMKKSGVKIILWLTLFSVAGGSIASFISFSRRFRANSMGTVNEQDIGFAEFRRKFAEVQHISQEVRKMYGPQADMILRLWGLDKSPDEYALDALVLEKVIQSAANGTGAQVNREYLNAKLRDPFFIRQYLGTIIPPQAIMNGTLDATILKYALQHQGISEQEFEEILDDTMRRVLFSHLVEAGVYVPKSSIRHAYEQEYTKRKFGVLALPLNEFLKKIKEQSLSEKEIETYYDKHKEAYRIPEKRSGHLWAFDPDSFGIMVSDKDIETAYNQRKRTTFIEKPEEYKLQYILMFHSGDEKDKIETRRKAQEVLKKVRAKPESFTELTRDPNVNNAGSDGGKTVTVPHGKYPALDQAVASLKPNEISIVFDAPVRFLGKDSFKLPSFVIVKLIGKNEATYKPLSKVRDELAKSLKQEKFAHEFNTHAQRVISQSADLPEVFKKFVQEKRSKESDVQNITADGSLRSERLFNLDKKGAKAFYEENGKGYIIELTDIVKSTIPPLNAVKEKVKNDLLTKKAQDEIQKEITDVLSKIKEKKQSLKEAAQSLPIKGDYFVTDLIDPQKPDSVKKLQEKKLPVHKIMGLTELHAVTHELNGQGGYVMELLEKESFNEKDFNEKKKQLEQVLRQQELGPLQKSFIDALKARATVVLNKDMIRFAGRK